MNELERLLAGTPAPHPSDRLDARVEALLALAAVRPPRPGWRQVLALGIAAAGIGIGGYYVGRHRALANLAPAQVAGSLPAAVRGDSPQLTNVPFSEDNFLRLFVHSDSREGLLGRGPVEVQILTPP